MPRTHPTQAAPETLAPELVATLRVLAKFVTAARDPWRLFGSAAMALHGADVGVVRDVDLLMSERDAAATLTAMGLAPAPGDGAEPFRSRVFGRWSGAQLPVEVMGGFQVLTARCWVDVPTDPAVEIALEDFTLHVAPAEDLLAMCALFDRPKDLARAAALRAIGATGEPNA